MSWAGQKVLVTGADGFIGSHLVEELLRAGAEVTGLALYDSLDTHRWLDDIELTAGDQLRVVRGDTRDAQQMMKVARGQHVVFHLASLISVPFSFSAPSSFLQTNVQGALNVLAAAHEAGVRRFVHTSTSEVYGTAQFTPITEDHPIRTQSPYAASKAAADHLAESFHHSFGLPLVTLRPFNTFGPRQSERAVISSVIRQAVDDRVSEIRVGNVQPKRDFTFVHDIVLAFLAVAKIEDTHLGQVFNAGSGEMFTIEQAVAKVRALTGCSKPLVQDQERLRSHNSEVMALQASSDRLLKATGWSPQHTFDEGLRRTIEWWRSRTKKISRDATYMT